MYIIQPDYSERIASIHAGIAARLKTQMERTESDLERCKLRLDRFAGHPAPQPPALDVTAGEEADAEEEKEETVDEDDSVGSKDVTFDAAMSPTDAEVGKVNENIHNDPDL